MSVVICVLVRHSFWFGAVIPPLDQKLSSPELAPNGLGSFQIPSKEHSQAKQVSPEERFHWCADSDGGEGSALSQAPFFLPARGKERGGKSWKSGWVKRVINQDFPPRVNHLNGEIKPIIQRDRKCIPPRDIVREMRADQSFSGAFLGCLQQKLLHCVFKMQIPGPGPRPHESEPLGARLGSEFYNCCPCKLYVGWSLRTMSWCGKTWKRNSTRGRALAESGGAGHLTPVTGSPWGLGGFLKNNRHLSF